MSFPISITWSGGAPPVAGFQQMAAAAKALDSSLQTTVGKMDQFAGSIGKIEAPIGGVATGVGQLKDGIGGLESTIGGAATGMGQFADATGTANGTISETGGFVTEATGSLGEFGGAATEAGAGATEFGTASTEAATGATELGTASTDTGTALGETNTVLGETNTVLGETVPAMEATATGATDTGTAFTELNPAVADTNSVMGEGISIFEGAGTAATDTASATGEYTGALGSLGSELAPVTGGLTENNTVMEDLATSTGDTATESGTLTGSLNTLGTGIGTVTGSALSLYSAYTNVRDAQAAVEKAQIKVIDANRKAETSFIKLNGAINKITQDTENQITGQDRLAAAWQKVVALWDSGVRSGPQLAAALQELRAAQDGMTSSTAKGNEQIAKLNPLISGFESNSRKAAGSALGLQRANEGLNESLLGVAGSIISGVSGLTQIATQGGAAFKAIGPLKGAFTDLKIASAAGFGPIGAIASALGAIAVPAAVAVGAIVGFVAAVTAIRANLKVFDDMGVTIGKVFPQLKGFLDDGRQAFINFSDGLNTGISMLLGGFDSLTGGVFGAQKAWNGFTGTLPKGTGELGLAAKATNLWALAMDNSSDKIRVGAGKWKEADGVLLRLNGSVLAAAGTWDVLGDGTAVFSKKMQPVPGQLDKTAQSADKAGASTTQMSEATKKAADELAAVGTSLEEANAKFTFYGDSAKLAELMTNSFALGIAEAKVELIDETAKLAEGAGALQEHSRQLAEGSIQAIAYKQGILEAGEALIEKVKALEQARGAYDATNVLIEEGTLLATEYASGMQETKTAVQEAGIAVVHLAGELAAYNDEATTSAKLNAEMAKGYLEAKEAVNKLAFETANAVGKIAALRQELADSGSAALRFGAGMIEGRAKALEYLVGIEQARGETAGFRAEVLKAAQAVPGALADMSTMSTKHLQRFIEVVKGVPEAFESVISDLSGFTSKVVSALGKAGEEGKDAFMENIEKMEEELGQTFSTPLKQDLQLAVDIDKAKKDVETGLGILGAALSAQPLTPTMDTSRIHEAIGIIKSTIATLPAAGQAGFAPLQGWLDKLGAWKPTGGITTLAPILAGIAGEAANMGQPMGNLLSAFGQMPAIANASATELQALSAAFSKVGLTLDTTTGQVTDASGKIVGSLGQIPPAGAAMASQMDQSLLALGASGDAARDAWGRDMQIMLVATQVFGTLSQLVAKNVSGAYANLATNVHASLSNMASGFQIILAATTKLQSDSQRMASTVSGSFSNMATNTRASMNTMASGFQVVIAAMVRIGSQAQTMNSTVTSAFRSATSAASSFSSGMSSSMSRAGSAMDSAASKARALQSAINALKSKTITITTVYVTIRRTVFAAAGGSFVQSNPGKVGPMSVSEFGQQELVTVTPLQTPGRQPVKGLSDLLGKEAEKKGRRAMTEEAEGEGKGKQKEVVMMRETPIVITVDGREIARVVNKRIFEESDALV